MRLIHGYFFYKKYTQFFHRFRVKYPLRPIHGIVLYAGIYGTSKIFERGNVSCFPLTGPSHLQNLSQKCKILNVFWTWPVTKSRFKQLELFSWLSNRKNVVLSNGSKTVRNVIQMALILKQLFFPKHYKRSPSGWGLRAKILIISCGWGLFSQTSVCDTFYLH